MRNKLIDLNNHLFEALERLNDLDLSLEQLKTEIERSKAMVNVAKPIIQNSRTMINAAKLLKSNGSDYESNATVYAITSGKGGGDGAA